jgi:hypothetical protein
MREKLSPLLPTNTWVRVVFAPALVFIATSVNHNYQTDFWHHLARGQAISERGGLVDHDLFTFTVPGKPFQDANWLSQVLYYRLFSCGGLELVQFVNSLTLAVVMSLLVGMCWRKSGSALMAGGLGVLAFLGLWQLLIIRPQTFSLLLFILVYAALEAAVRRRWWLSAPPILLALWANMHGGFPIGLVLVGCYVLASACEGWWSEGWSAVRRASFLSWAACLAACVVATFLNPYGWKVYEYVGVTSSIPSSRRIDEWLPPGMDQLVGKIWVISVLALIVLFALPRRRPTTREVCLVLCFLPLACSSVRMVSWWLLVSTPIAARLLAGVLPAKGTATTVPEKPALGAGLTVVGILLLSAASVPWLDAYNPALILTHRNHRTESDLEDVAVQLRQRPGEGRIFSRFEWGEYLGWALSPRYKVFLDGRLEIFPDAVWADFTAVTRGRADWEDILARYEVDCLLLDQSGFHHDLLPQVERSGNWIRICESGDAVLFVRQPADAAVVSRGAQSLR